MIAHVLQLLQLFLLLPLALGAGVNIVNLDSRIFTMIVGKGVPFFVRFDRNDGAPDEKDEAFKTLAERYAASKEVIVGHVGISMSGYMTNQDLLDKYGLKIPGSDLQDNDLDTSFPKFRYFPSNGGEGIDYAGDVTSDAMTQFLKKMVKVRQAEASAASRKLEWKQDDEKTEEELAELAHLKLWTKVWAPCTHLDGWETQAVEVQEGVGDDWHDVFDHYGDALYWDVYTCDCTVFTKTKMWADLKANATMLASLVPKNHSGSVYCYDDPSWHGTFDYSNDAPLCKSKPAKKFCCQCLGGNAEMMHTFSCGTLKNEYKKASCCGNPRNTVKLTGKYQALPSWAGNKSETPSEHPFDHDYYDNED